MRTPQRRRSPPRSGRAPGPSAAATGRATVTTTNTTTATAAGAGAAGAAARATIALLQAHSLTSAVHAEIERQIGAGELAPGDKLTEALLAERLGVSRGPVREAFRILEEAGLVRQEKNRGVFVRTIPLEEAIEIYDLRAMLEESVGRRLATCITPEQLRRLRATIEQMDAAARALPGAGAGERYHRLNLEFHQTMVDFVGNRKLASLYRRIVNELTLFRRASLAGGRQVPTSLAEHRAIVKAIAAGDAEGTAQALRTHVLNSKERMLRAQGGDGHGASGRGPAGTTTARTRHA
jgi:phosphonate utilization transcriptional regulator